KGAKGLITVHEVAVRSALRSGAVLEPRDEEAMLRWLIARAGQKPAANEAISEQVARLRRRRNEQS
ncbi:MAG TPA: hypothetical protein VJU79_02925, partial [Candidatus Dormibacteraeota bacterium]|nr:hypothetical protein [Candidatus Dormibacteraeota bacterium]